MFRALIAVLLFVLVSHPTVARSKELSKETHLLVHLNAFKPLGLELERSVELLAMAFVLDKADLGFGCIPKAANIDEMAFRRAYADHYYTLSLIYLGVPVNKAISVVQIFREKNPNDEIRNLLEVLFPAFDSTGQLSEDRPFTLLLSALKQSRVLFEAGFESHAPFKARGFDLDLIPDAQIPDAFLDDVDAFLDKHGHHSPLPFEGELDMGSI